jgi:group I intron endonuclease
MHIYKITNNVNGMSYIGQTMHPMSHRLSRHLYSARNGSLVPLCQAIRQFGRDAFSVTILQETENHDELMRLEVEAIKEHGTIQPFGYNVTSGGRGTADRKAFESTRLAISRALTGKKLSESHRAGISRALMGNTYAKGNIGRAAWNRGVPFSEQHRSKHLAAVPRGQDHYCAKTIELNGQTYPSIKDAALETGLTRMQVRYRLATGRARYINPPSGGESPKEKSVTCETS